MSKGSFAPDYEFLKERVSSLFDYIKGDILINEVSPEAVQFHSEPLFSSVVPFIRRAVYIDTPNREATVAVASYPHNCGDECDKYYAIFMEECYGDNKSILVVDCSREQFYDLLQTIEDILQWAEESEGVIAIRKLEVITKIMKHISRDNSF